MPAEYAARGGGEHGWEWRERSRKGRKQDSTFPAGTREQSCTTTSRLTAFAAPTFGYNSHSRCGIAHLEHKTSSPQTPHFSEQSNNPPVLDTSGKIPLPHFSFSFCRDVQTGFSYKNEISPLSIHDETEEMTFLNGFEWECEPVLLLHSLINKDLT